VGSSCEFGIEPSGSINCWETIDSQTTRDLSSSAQLHGVRYKEKHDKHVLAMCVHGLTKLASKRNWNNSIQLNPVG
jgi:hypothetical protein